MQLNHYSHPLKLIWGKNSMSLRSLWATIALLAAGMPAVLAAADGSEQCTIAFTNHLSKVSQHQQDSVAFAMLDTLACKRANSNNSIGFDSATKSVLDSVPILSNMKANLNVSSNKELCKKLRDNRFQSSRSENYVFEPAEAAMRELNACYEIFRRSRGVTVTAQNDHPGLVTFFGIFNTTETTLRVGATTKGDFHCEMPQVGAAAADLHGPQLQVKENFNVRCSRTGMVTANGEAFGPGAAILQTSAGEFRVIVPGDTVLGPSTQREARAAIDAAISESVRAKAQAEALEQRYRGRVVSSHPFYFGEGPDMPSYGRRWGCGWWRGGISHWRPDVEKQLCRDGTVIYLERHRTESGDKCGYNYYTLVCERFSPVTSLAN